ncbi:MAG TPA: diguanylate cyclase [Syntrophales bacterium]|nr:diguanylate cyclase [Syntrophales bacterium]
MTIKQKSILLLCAAIVIFELLHFSVQQFVVFPSFITLEQEEAKQNLGRSILAIENELQHLDALCHDWAAWNDTVQFMKDRNSEYQAGNLLDTTFFDARLNLIQYFDVNGRYFFGKSIDLQTGKPIDMGDFPIDMVSADSPLHIDYSQQEGLGEVRINGIWMVNNVPMLIAARPILTSENVGPAHGLLIMGRLLDDQYEKLLCEQTQVDFSILPIGGTNNAAEVEWVLSQYKAGIQQPSKKVSDQFIYIYSVYKGLNGNDAFIIRTAFPRDIAKKGMETIKIALLFSLLTGILFLVLIIFILDRMLLRPISRLTRHTQSIEENGDYSARIQMKRSDEIGRLAHAFDGMIATIEWQTNEMADMNKELEHLSFQDELTQTFNRRYFDQQLPIILSHMHREKEPCSLIIADLDFFKQYNDTYGHVAGDNCLQVVSDILRTHCRRSLDLVARYGGEEFGVILPNANREEALRIAEQLRQDVQNAKIEHHASLISGCISISLGVTTVDPETPYDVPKVIETADSALYEAKRSGRNCSVFKEYVG